MPSFQYPLDQWRSILVIDTVVPWSYLWVSKMICSMRPLSKHGPHADHLRDPKITDTNLTRIIQKASSPKVSWHFA